MIAIYIYIVNNGKNGVYYIYNNEETRKARSGLIVVHGSQKGGYIDQIVRFEGRCY